MTVAVRVIPCLDVDQGRVVKGVHFKNLRDAGDPVELAAAYYQQGADELTFLDVTASGSGRATMVDLVKSTADQIFIPLTVGGGVRTPQDVDILLRSRLGPMRSWLLPSSILVRCPSRTSSRRSMRPGIRFDGRPEPITQRTSAPRGARRLQALLADIGKLYPYHKQ